MNPDLYRDAVMYYIIRAPHPNYIFFLNILNAYTNLTAVTRNVNQILHREPHQDRQQNEGQSKGLT